MEFYPATRKKKLLPLEHILISEMTDSERQIPHGITDKWNLEKSKTPGESRKVVGRDWGSGGNRERLVKGHKLSAVRRIRSENLTYSVVGPVDNTVLYNWNFPGE